MTQENWLGLVLPILIVLIVIGRRVFVAGGARGGTKSYGLAGGAVCRKCGRAFGRPVWAPNLMVGKLLRCPHCSAWAVLPAASQAEIEMAEALERGPENEGVSSSSPEEALRRRIAESQYETKE